ncbi:MAG: DUF805 domain-containing protein [Halioglobus sp.]|nr:DUF805 domain-containing protein [Halioglobus sp.]
MNWYLQVLNKYTQFDGRSRRKEYWMFILINMVISFILTFVDRLTGTLNPDVGLGLLSGIYTLAVLIPSIAVACRRLHDTGKSGWWLLILIVPLIGWLVLVIFFVQDSQTEENQYGVCPKRGNH